MFVISAFYSLQLCSFIFKMFTQSFARGGWSFKGAIYLYNKLTFVMFYKIESLNKRRHIYSLELFFD